MSDPVRRHTERLAEHLKLGHDRADSVERMELVEDVAAILWPQIRRELGWFDQETCDRNDVVNRLYGLAAMVNTGADLGGVADALAELSVRVDGLADRYRKDEE